MPLIRESAYSAPFWLPGGHCQTIYPSFFRKVQVPDLQTYRLNTPDGDFLLLERAQASTSRSRLVGSLDTTNSRVVILSHGLEGHSRRQYILGMARTFMDAGWDAIAWNFRFCSPFAPDGVGEPNFAPRMYHSGETGDLRTVLEHALSLGYTEILLVGFSMGGNQILKFFGEDGDALPSEVRGGVAVSVPCDLTASCRELSRGFNKVYVKNFLKTLLLKVKRKHAQTPDLINIEGIDSIESFDEFDGRYTAPLHGFASAGDYWAKASSKQFLGGIRRPVLLLNSMNDPFLPAECLPYDAARESEYLFLETPNCGGHVGFTAKDRQPWGDRYWSEWRALEFSLGITG
ncbi:alpha/beta fold hydrolase [Desulfovibrio sp. OttesenSCG-928-C06]|nr:alpha/beta fold hydrolase [Desulfovibrio sp. OttesenSCG-928-C06]